MRESMASELIPLPARTLRLGMTLPYDLFDAGGQLLFARGQTLRDSPLVRSLIDGGAWVNADQTMEYQRARAHRLDTLVMQDVPLADIAKADSSFRLEQPAAPKVELGPREAWSDLLLHTHNLLREGVDSGQIHEVGNTVIDALHWAVDRKPAYDNADLERIDESTDRVLLVTAHRRESHGEPMAEICRALDHAHGWGVIHRDLKPSNVMLTTDKNGFDVVKVVDFGIAKLLVDDDGGTKQNLTQTGDVFGSPLYMSPEQVRGDALDPRADVYGLGVVATSMMSPTGGTSTSPITWMMPFDACTFCRAIG